jgi:hypothetical protein
MEIIDRIIEVQLEEHHHSQRAFELSIGKKSGYLNISKKRQSVPGADVINKIIEVYPKYSLKWLMTGEGNKYANDAIECLNEPESVYKKEIAETDFMGLSKRIDVVINQNDEILDKLNRSIAKDLLKQEKKRLDHIKK